MGTIYGNGGRHQTYPWDEGVIPRKETDNREDLWNGERESWIQIYTALRESPNGNEGRAYLFMYESKEAGKNATEDRKDWSERTPIFER